MAEYIEREATCKDCVHYDICIFHHKGNENKDCVRFKNKADVVEVRRGHWINDICSVCGVDLGIYGIDWFNYCPFCGAKMDGKENTGG